MLWSAARRDDAPGFCRLAGSTKKALLDAFTKVAPGNTYKVRSYACNDKAGGCSFRWGMVGKQAETMCARPVLLLATLSLTMGSLSHTRDAAHPRRIVYSFPTEAMRNVYQNNFEKLQAVRSHEGSLCL